MKRLVALGAILGLFIAASGALAGEDARGLWRSLAGGGGGTSSGGRYAVTGTVGQPSTGVMKGAKLTLEGGFWGAQSPGSGLLSQNPRVIYLPHLRKNAGGL